MEPVLLRADSVKRLTALAKALELPDFDLLLVGDGSGTVYNQPAGWACVAYDRRKERVTAHAGALSGGTNNFAELAPYVQALWHHHQDHGQKPAEPVRVQVVSDSQVTVRCGNGLYGRKANRCLWSSIEWFEGNGYKLGWRDVPRNSNEWSDLMDTLAGKARRLMLPRPRQGSAGGARAAASAVTREAATVHPLLQTPGGVL